MPDFFDEMTREELVAWARKSVFPDRWPRKSDVLYIRWEIGTEKIRARQEENHRYFKTIDLKRHDALAREFNASTSDLDRIRILKEIKKIDQQVKVWSKEESAIMKADRKLDRIYEAAAREREKERTKKGSKPFDKVVEDVPFGDCQDFDCPDYSPCLQTPFMACYKPPVNTR